MKKKFITTLLIPVMLTGCSPRQSTLEVTVGCPAGAPALSLYDNIKDGKVEIVTPKAVSSLLAYMANGKKDAIIVPTNAGVDAIKAGAEFKIAATLTFGNFYIASTGKDDNDTLDADDYLVCSQENNIVGLIFRAVYGTTYTNVHYVGDNPDAATCLASGINTFDSNAEVKYVVIAEPAMTNVMNKKATVKQVRDIQEDYKTKFGNSFITQASVFVNNKTSKNKIDSFLETLEGNVNQLLTNPDEILRVTQGMEETEISAYFATGDAALLRSVIDKNSVSLGYNKASDIKNEIDQFLTNLGKETTSEEIYYI